MVEDRRREFPDLPYEPQDLDLIRQCLARTPAERLACLSTAPFDPQTMLSVLEQRAVDYVVIGGVAAALRGAPLVTADLDLCPSTEPANLERLALALRDLTARIRTEGAPEGLPFACDATSLTNVGVLDLVTRAGSLDLCFVPSGTAGYADLLEYAERVVIADGVAPSVAALEDVIRSKEAAGRPEDLAALPSLRLLLAEIRRRARRHWEKRTANLEPGSGWVVTHDVVVDDEDDDAIVLLRMSAHWRDGYLGEMRCARNGAVWHLGSGPQGGSRRPPPLQPGEFQGSLGWESGEKVLFVGDLLVPEIDPKESGGYSSKLERDEACRFCGKIGTATHAINVHDGQLNHRMYLLCVCGRGTTASSDNVPDEIEYEFRARDGMLSVYADLDNTGVLIAALAAAAEIEMLDARERVEKAKSGAPLFVGWAHVAEVVAQRLEIEGVLVRRR